MKAYKIKGTFLMKDTWRSFTKEIVAESEENAREKILSIIGSMHKASRKMIKIASIQELKLKDIEDPVVKYAIEGHHG